LSDGNHAGAEPKEGGGGDVNTQIRLPHGGLEHQFQELAERKQAIGLLVRLGLRETHRLGGSLFPLTTLFHQLDALETLEDIASGADAGGSFEASVLRHGRENLKNCVN